METISMSINRWLDKEKLVHIYNEILFSHKKGDNNAIFRKWMYLEIVILNEISQTEKKKSYDIAYMWNLKYDTNELIY